MPKKKTQEEVIQDFITAHGDEYDYSLVIYINNITPVKIICKKHGVFEQKPEKHKSGQGCPECGREKTNAAQRMDWNDFVTEAKKVHSDKYEYVRYKDINAHGWVEIRCRKHGYFKQKVYSHLQGHGCKWCAVEESAQKRAITKAEFIERAEIKHGDRYDYSLVDDIKNNRTVVKIICKQCGTTFAQRVNNHLNGQGCPKCKASKLETETERVLKSKRVAFNTQKTFEWLKTNKNHRMFLDFYLPELNIAIECQGEQHYNSRRSGIFTEEKVDIIKQRDKLKYQLCQKHNIRIYYIKYNETVENSVNKILNISDSCETEINNLKG